MSKKGVKKGHCLIHGKVTEENSVLKNMNGIRRKVCKICMSDNRAIADYNKKISKGRCIKHGLVKNAENNYQCRICKNEWNKKDRLKDPTKYKNWVKKCKDNNKDIYRENEILRVHRIDRDKYYELLEKQNNLCAICDGIETRLGRNGKELAKLCLDHCHETGVIRGFLCHACNTAIGKFKDRIDFLEKAIDYLKGFKEGGKSRQP